MKKALVLIPLLGALCAGAADYDVSLADFPRLAGEADDTGRLQRAVDAAAKGGVLYLPRGTYGVSSTIQVTNGTSLLMHKSAHVKALAKMPYVFDVDLRKHYRGWSPTPDRDHDYNLFVTGGHIDGDGLASCLHLQHYLHFTLRDTTFMNGYPYGLHVDREGAEVIAQNLYFKGTKNGLAGNVALYTEGNDSQYTDCVMVDYTVGLRATAGANRFTRLHAWGGMVPPKPGEKVGEMLVKSICFQIPGHLNTLKDCYADTGWIGFDIGGYRNQVIGCWYLNNAGCHLDDVTIVRQLSGASLTVADCVFNRNVPHTRVYEGNGSVTWRNITYDSFGPDAELPGEAFFGPEQACATADEWNCLNLVKPVRMDMPAGAFVKKDSCQGWSYPAGARRLAKRFPDAGAGTEVVVRARATCPATKKVELRLHFRGGRIWGTEIPLSTEWTEWRMPLKDLRYFSHWANVPKLDPGETPDARRLETVGFTYGNWLCGDAVDQPHGFEVDYVRIVGR